MSLGFYEPRDDNSPMNLHEWGCVIVMFVTIVVALIGLIAS